MNVYTINARTLTMEKSRSHSILNFFRNIEYFRKIKFYPQFHTINHLFLRAFFDWLMRVVLSNSIGQKTIPWPHLYAFYIGKVPLSFAIMIFYVILPKGINSKFAIYQIFFIGIEYFKKIRLFSIILCNSIGQKTYFFNRFNLNYM